MRQVLNYARGSILIVIMMILGAATLVGFLALSRASLSRILDADNSVKAFTLREKVYGCMEEVLLQWRKDVNWASPTVVTGVATCDVTVTSSAPDKRTAAVRFNENNYYFGVDVTIDTDTFEIVDLVMSL